MGVIKEHNYDKNNPIYSILSDFSSPEMIEKFMLDLCTEKELIMFEQRITICLSLLQGKSYLDIISETGASSATISNVKKFCLTSGVLENSLNHVINDAQEKQILNNGNE